MTDLHDDHTLVITTFNRPQYLFRLLSFIAGDLPVGQVRVVDGSVEPYRSENRRVVAAFAGEMPITLEQLEPGIDILDHHRHAYCCADTPFMTFCHDDNFCVPATIRESILFLRSNPDYVNCSGLIAGIRKTNGRIAAYVSDAEPLLQEAPLERLAHFLANHWSADFGTWRSQARRSAIATFDLYHLDEAIGEPMSCGVSALLGKFHLLPKVSVIFCAHQGNRGSEAAQRKSNLVMPEFPGILTSVSTVVADFCRDWGIEPPLDGRAYYLTAYLRYMAKWWHQFQLIAKGIRSLAEAGLSPEDLRAVDERAEAAVMSALLGLSDADAATIRDLQRTVAMECDPSKGELFVVLGSDIVLADVVEPKEDAATVMALPPATMLPAAYRALHEMLLRPDWHERYCAFYHAVSGTVLGRLAVRIDAREIFDAAFLNALVSLVRPLHGAHPSRVDLLAHWLDIDADVSPAREALLLAAALTEAYPAPRYDDASTEGAVKPRSQVRFRVFGARPPDASVPLPLATGTVTKSQGVAFIPLDLSGAPTEHFNAGYPLWLSVQVAQVRGKMQFGLYDRQSLDLLVPVTERSGPRTLYFPIRSLATEYLIMRDITRPVGHGQCRISRLQWIAGRRPSADFAVRLRPDPNVIGPGARPHPRVGNGGAKQTRGPTADSRDLQHVILSTMPRSGTWYNLFLWENLDMLMTGPREYRLTDGPHYYHSIGVAKMHSHFVFPGFAEMALPDAVTRYCELEFHTQGYNAAIALDQHFTFQGNPDLRVLYVHRNPLDQIISIYDHSLQHVDKTLLIPPRKYDSERPYESASDLAMRGGAESYLKQYLTYRHFADLGFPQLMMVSYETLKREPTKTFESMLRFCGAELGSESRVEMVRRAVELSASDRVAELEAKKGRSIGGDQTGKEQSHMRGGEIGKWKARLSPEAVDHVWSLFARYGVHDTDFQLH